MKTEIEKQRAVVHTCKVATAKARETYDEKEAHRRKMLEKRAEEGEAGASGRTYRAAREDADDARDLLGIAEQKEREALARLAELERADLERRYHDAARRRSRATFEGLIEPLLVQTIEIDKAIMKVGHGLVDAMDAVEGARREHEGLAAELGLGQLNTDRPSTDWFTTAIRRRIEIDNAPPSAAAEFYTELLREVLQQTHGKAKPAITEGTSK